MNGRLMVLFLALPALYGGTDRAVAERWANYWAGQYGIAPELVRALIEVESAWKANAVSNKGAAGLMQLMPGTAREFGVRNRFDIAENTRAGVAYLARLLTEFRGDWRLALAGYYAGENRIRPRGLGFSDPDVFRYVSQVGRIYWRLCREGRLRRGGYDATGKFVVDVGGGDGRRSR